MGGFIVGSNANNGANAGFSYSNTNYTPSNANTYIGSQLMLLKIEQNNVLASWQKITITQKSVGRETEGSEYEKQKKE